MSSNIKRFILFGDSGAGKSSFVNIFYNYCYGTRNPDDVFGEDQQGVKLAIPCKNWMDRIQDNEISSERDIHDQTKGQTINCTLYKLRFDKVAIELIDTPGFNDAEGVSEDDAILNKIEQVLRNIPYLSGIIIIANGSTARLGKPFLNFIRLLHEVCPNNLMQNVCAVLTNCDDTSCNLPTQILRNDLKVNETGTFHLQNSLFGWDRTTSTKKIIRTFRRDFEDTVETLGKLVLTLARFDDVSTEAFRLGELKRRGIQKCIVTSIEKIIDLLKINRLERIAAEGLSGAKETMAANTNWTKQTTITAFKWMEVEASQPSQQSLSNNSNSIFHTENGNTRRVSESMKCETSPTKIKCVERDSLSYSQRNARDAMPPVHSHADSEKSSSATVELPAHQSLERSSKRFPTQYGDDDDYQHQTRSRDSRKYQRQNLQLQVTVHDNEARSHHETARRQAKFLQAKATAFANKHDELISSMKSLLDELEDNVRDMRQINTEIDLLERNKDCIEELRKEIELGGNERKMMAFFDEVVQILSKPKAKGC